MGNTYTFYFLVIIATVLIIFAGGWTFYSPQNNPPAIGQIGVLLSTTPVSTKKSLQINTLRVVSPSLTLTPTLIPAALPLDSCNSPSSNLSELVNTISKNFGIRLNGNALTVPRAQAVYQSMCLAFQSPVYIKNLNSLKNPVNVSFTYVGSCFAWTYANPPHVVMEEPCDTTLIDKYVIIHELTHIMQFGAAQGRNAHFPEWQAQVWNRERNHKIPTGPCVFEDPGDGGECEADAVAEYIYYKVYRNSWGGRPAGSYTFSNYPTSYPLWYNFVKQYFFPGISY